MMSDVVPDASVGSAAVAQSTLYVAILAAGAMPAIRPTPWWYIFALTPQLPAAVEDVCDPCPTPSRADLNSAGDHWFLQFQPRNTWSPHEFASARDGVGHGSHTSSTAAGDYGVKTKVFGKHYGRITGIAPAAKIATYKALWATADDPSDASGFNSDIVAAIDRAVSDGVDVINFSVGFAGGDSDIIDPIAVAFLNAAASGVFVATAGGNDGPDAATVSNVSPWVTTAAASTWQTASGTVVLGNGQKVLGASLTSDGTKAPLVYAADVSKKPTGSDGATAAQCGLGTLDRSKVAGKIVLCDRGENVLVNKVADAQRAHAAGIIIGDVTQTDIAALSVPLPMVSVHIDGRTKILDYINQPGGANATLVDGNKTSQKAEPVPAVAGFSSRGPSQINADVLKPDVAAPGVGVLAAVAPPSNSGQNFDFYDGTSMASPHIAGLAAWQLGKRPKLGPDELRSMFMTTAHDTVDADGHKAHDAFAQGAGQVSARRLGDPGLVFPAGIVAWFAWLEGQGISTGTGIPGIPGYDLNEPVDHGLVPGVVDHAHPHGQEHLRSPRDLPRIVQGSPGHGRLVQEERVVLQHPRLHDRRRQEADDRGQAATR